MSSEGGLFKINLADLDDEEEDDDYIPQAKEIEEYNREKKEDRGYKLKKSDAETQEQIRENWAKFKAEIREEESAKFKAVIKQSQKLLRDHVMMKQIVESALSLNREEKSRKVIFAGQEFIVDANGEIVGRADEQAHLKEFQLFDGNKIGSINLDDPSSEQKALVNQIQDKIDESIKLEEKNSFTEQSTKIDEEIKDEPIEQEKDNEENEEEKKIFQADVKIQQTQEVIEEKQRKDLKEQFSYLLLVMDKIQSKSKSISSIHKSKLDWKSFTKKEKLEKKFEQNRKGGYLDKQNFIAKATEKQKQISKQSRR